MARNTYQVLDSALTPKSELLICWTPDAATSKTTIKTGGTGQAIRIAYANNIQVWNLANQKHFNKICKTLTTVIGKG